MPVSDVRTKAIAIDLDKRRYLRYDLNALALLEERFGGLDEMAQAFERPSARTVRAVLHAGLVHEDPGLTEQQVGAMLTLAELPGIVSKIGEALSLAMPAADPNVKRPPGPAALEGEASTGPGSTTPGE